MEAGLGRSGTPGFHQRAVAELRPVRTVRHMLTVGILLASWVAGSFLLVAVAIAAIALGRARRRRRGRGPLPRDVADALEQVYAGERAAERERAVAYLRGLRNRQVRLTAVGLRGKGDRGDRLMFGDGTTIHLLPGGSLGVGDLCSFVAAGNMVALAAIDLCPGDVTFTFRSGRELLHVQSSDLAVL